MHDGAQDERYEVIPFRAAAEFRRLPHPARNILKLCDGVRPREAIFASSPLPAERTEQVLERLLQLGVVSVRGRAHRETPPSPPQDAFSDDEERFFTSSIDHLIEND